METEKLEARSEGMVPRADYEATLGKYVLALDRINELQEELESARASVEALEGRIEYMVPRGKYRDVVAKRGLLLEDHHKLMKELEAARAELGEWRLMGGARGKVKKKDAKAKLEDKHDGGRR